MDDIAKIFASNKAAVHDVFSKLASMEPEQRDLFICLAALSTEDRSMLIGYWEKLWGNEFATDITKDYLNRGKKKPVEASAGKNMQKKAALDSTDRSLLKEYWDGLYGGEFAGDMVEDYKNESTEQVKVEAAGNYDKLIQVYANVLGEDTVKQLRSMTKEAAAQALEQLARKKK